MSRLIVGPFNRVEGDLEVDLEIADGRVAAARVTAPLYRGFEQILAGRAPGDALAVAPRICGICSVSQSMAAAAALADAAGVAPTPNGRRALNLVHAAENLADHLTHFHLFFMPDFARAAYAGRAWHATAVERFAAMKGGSALAFLPARARFLHLMGLLAGKWPHSLAIQPGGSTKGVDAGEKVRLIQVLAGFRRFLEERLFADALERVAALDSPAALEAWRAERAPDQGDLRFFLHLAADLGLEELGRGPGVMMSHGALPDADGPLFARGVWRDGACGELDTAAVVEDVTHAWMSGGPAHPSAGHTLPDADKPEAYSWCKAPRLDGRAVEVGAYARQAIDGQPLIRALAASRGANVRDRVLARLIEVARLLPAMERWARALQPREAYCHHAAMPEAATGAGLVEAARGSLGHWLTLRDGRIAAYQIVAPTTWNFSPRDAAGQPGPLEQALAGTPVRPGETTPIAVQHVVRSFDPCMVCTVH